MIIHIAVDGRSGHSAHIAETVGQPHIERRGFARAFGEKGRNRRKQQHFSDRAHDHAENQKHVGLVKKLK